MNLARLFTSVLPAIAASLLFAACVDLTQPRVSQGGQASTDAATGGSGGSAIAGPDAANGSSGGGVSVGGVPTGGTAVGGAGGATTNGGTSGTIAGGAENVAVDAAAGATSTGSAGFDAPAPSDVGGGGSAGIGGTSATGGRSATGGASASGGKSATAGASASGGKSATGGASASGGKSATGGASASGGKGATAGATGGTSASGGVTPGGGTSAVAGTSATGGTSATAGTSATGGTTATGGTVADAGVTPMIISIDFVGGEPPGDSGATGTVAMAATESAGVKRVANWNSAADNTGARSSLVLADGTATSASVTWSTPIANLETSATWILSWADSPGDVRMMNGYLDPRAVASPATVTVSGLASPMSSGYDVYVYCFEDMTWGDTRTSKYTIGSTTHTVTQTEPPLVTSFSGFTLAPEAGAGNYVVFKNVTGASFTLTATPGTSLHQTVRAPVNGIQIVYPSGY